MISAKTADAHHKARSRKTAMQKPPAGTFPADIQKVAFDKAKGHLSHRKTWHIAMQNAVDCKPGCKRLALNTLATAHHPPAFGRAGAPNYTPKKIPPAHTATTADAQGDYVLQLPTGCLAARPVTARNQSTGISLLTFLLPQMA